MKFVSAQQIAENIDFHDLIEALRKGFREKFVTPIRHHHSIERADRPNSTLLLMPAWTDFSKPVQSEGGYSGVKIANVLPDNARFQQPSVQAVYLLFEGKTGAPIAIIDGQALTFWRTSCASALASSYLSNSHASKLLMIGAGALAPWLIKAHCAIRPIDEILVWNRNYRGAQILAEKLSQEGLKISATKNLKEAVHQSHIISSATLSNEPLVKGHWLNPGTHVDLVGGFTPSMREADDQAIRRSDLFVDTMEGGLNEPGDIVQPLKQGIISADDIQADLFDLARNKHTGRTSSDQITLFKSTGTSLEDLIGAILIYQSICKVSA